MLFVVTKKELQNKLRELYREITEVVNIKSIISDMFAKEGITLESAVKAAVTEYCQMHDTKIVPHLVADTVKEEAIERLIDDELDLDKIHELVAEKIAARILAESELKSGLMEEVAEQVADSVWDNFDMDEFYPIMGEKCLALFKKQ